MEFFLCILLIALVSADHPGHRGPEKHFDYINCCKVESSPAAAKFIETMVNLAEECKQEIGGLGPENRHRIVCFHECMGNKIKILNSDESLNEDMYRTFVTTQMATEDFQKAVADGIVTKCIEKVKTPDSSEEESLDDCSKTAMIAIRCASRELINSCPVDKQDTDEHCVKFREMITNGKSKHGKGPRLNDAHEESQHVNDE